MEDLLDNCLCKQHKFVLELCLRRRGLSIRSRVSSKGAIGNQASSDRPQINVENLPDNACHLASNSLSGVSDSASKQTSTCVAPRIYICLSLTVHWCIVNALCIHIQGLSAKVWHLSARDPDVFHGRARLLSPHIHSWTKLQTLL